MATRWAVASGNWSNPATWNGGTLPAADDDVFADNFNVTVNQSITVLSLSNRQRSGGTLGGNFNVSISGVTINAANVYGGQASNACLSNAAGISFTLNGNVWGSNANNGRGIWTRAGNVIVNGNVSADAFLNSLGCQLIGNTNLTINGNVNGSSASGSNGLSTDGTSTPIVVVNGNAQAGSVASASAIRNVGPGSITLNGIAIASDQAEAIDNASTGTFTIAAARHAPNGRAPWTGNGRIFFSNLELAHVTVNNAANVQRMLGRRLLAPLGSFDGGFHG